MNRRSLLQAFGLAPIAALVPRAAPRVSHGVVMSGEDVQISQFFAEGGLGPPDLLRSGMLTIVVDGQRHDIPFFDS
jgi:hypothetical protein